MSTTDVFDLDALLPEPKKIKIQGKIIDANPPTVRQILHIQKVMAEIKDQNLSGEEAEEKLIDVLSVIVPEMKKDKNLDFTLEQLLALITYLQKEAVPDNIAVKQYPDQKKTV